MFLYSKHLSGRKNLLSLGNRLNVVRFDHTDANKIDNSHKVNNLEKRFLVWTGKYKSINDVPAFVTQSAMERSRNRMRIKIANYMMLATAIGCIAMIYKGKQDAQKGESLAKQNKEWHAKIKAEAQEK